MNMKSNAKLMMMMAMSDMFMGSIPGGQYESSPLTKDDIERIRKQQLLSKGCKEFTYEYKIGIGSAVCEVTIIALNKKNADRKYNKFIKLYKESL